MMKIPIWTLAIYHANDNPSRAVALRQLKDNGHSKRAIPLYDLCLRKAKERKAKLEQTS